MKKIFTLSVLAFFMALHVSGQYYYLPHIDANENPGGVNTELEYPYQGGMSAAWTVILAGGQSLGTYSANQTIPFAFSFNGSPETQYKVSNTGVLTFDVGSSVVVSSSSPSALPSASIPDKSVVVWGIADADPSDNVASATFGSAPNRQHWVFFSSYTKGSNWTYWSIVLEETTNKIYIVDQRHSAVVSGLTLGVQINSTTASQVQGSPSVSSFATADPTPDDNTYYEFIQGVQPSFDLAGESITMSQYNILASAPFNITGELINFGSATVTGFTLNYSINGGSAVSAPITGVNIGPYSTYAFSHPAPWNPSASGTYSIDVWATNINGNADQNTANDIVSRSVEVVDAYTPRVSLMEVFTSSTCAPCKPGNENTEAIFGNNPLGGNFAHKWTMVKFQQDFPGSGDPYCTNEAVSRRNFYAINSIPRLEIDGGWDQNAQSMTTGIFDNYNDIPAYVGMKVNMTVSGQTCNIYTEMYPVADIADNNMRLFYAIVEKHTTANVKSNGENDFYFVMKKMVPDLNGKPIGPFTKGNLVTDQASYTFNGTYRLPSNGLTASRINHATEHSVEEFNDLSVVAWIQNPSTKMVYQSAYPGIVSFIPEELSGVESFNVFPNPANEVMTMAFELSSETTTAQAEIVNLLGQRIDFVDFGTTTNGIYQKQFDVSSYAPGIYMVRLTVDGKTETRKVIIK